MQPCLSLPTLALVLAAVGCGDPTATGLGRAEALIQDPPAGPAVVIGSLAGNTFASVSADGANWADLGSPNGITVPLQTPTGAATIHGEQDVRVGTYTRVRLVFAGVTARLKTGSVVAGTTLTSDIDLPLGGSDQRVEIVVIVPTFNVDLDASVQRTILFNLRSSLWLTPAALQAGTVADAALQAAIIATTRVEPR